LTQLSSPESDLSQAIGLFTLEKTHAACELAYDMLLIDMCTRNQTTPETPIEYPGMAKNPS
jgi:hypothetical protein